MDKPFQAYAGDAPYLFVCYAHDDKALVYPELIHLKNAGINIWYDEGISPGSEWSDSIASHIEDCAAFLYFVTPRSIASEHCRREVNFAAEQPCELLAIHLEDTDLPSGLKLMLSHRQAILKHDHSPSVYEDKLVKALSSIMNLRPIQKEVPEEARGPKGSKTLLAFSMVVVLALIGVSGIYYYNRPAEPIQNAEGPPAAIAEKSIAVLPFINMSSDPEQDYFADGLTEELLNKLAQVHDLQVTARTSSFFYKNKQINVQEVGKTLGVAHLLEGSVRKSGDQLRITAQLINTADGFHLWSESFDRPLSDVFAIQDEIAEKVTTTLSITLGAGEFNRPGMTNNIEAYEAYLRANSGGVDNLLARIEYAERAVKLDPDFGLAWLALAGALSVGFYSLPQDQTVGFMQKLEEAFAQANAVAGNSLEVRGANATFLMSTGNYLEAEQLFLEIRDEHRTDRTAAGALTMHGDLIELVGRPEEAMPLARRAQRLDPLSSNASFFLALTLTYVGKFDEALAEAERGLLLEASAGYTDFHLIKWYITLQTGDRFAVADAIAEMMGDDDPRVQGLRADDIAAARAWVRDYANDPATSIVDKTFTIHLATLLGDPELALEILLQAPFWGQSADASLWMDHMRDMRQLAGFKDFLRNYGIYDYWVGTGNWAPQCRPLADKEDDFECF